MDLDEKTNDSSNIIIKVYNQEDGKTNTIYLPTEDSQALPSPSGDRDTYIWSYKATVALIKCMESFTEDLNDYKLRKSIFDSITSHLNADGHNCNSTQVHNKWKTLVRGFRHANLLKNQTGRKGRFVFYKEMKMLLANMPSYNPNHPIHLHHADPINIHVDHDYHDGTSTNGTPKPSIKRSDKDRIDYKDVEDGTLKFLYRCEKSKQARHKEKMIIELRKVALLENILNKLGP